MNLKTFVNEVLDKYDYVRVVRCEDCEHFVDNKNILPSYCTRTFLRQIVKMNDYCSYCKRKQD